MGKEFKKKVAIAVDFDGTLFKEGCYPEVGEPIRDRIDFVNWAHMMGFIIVIWTLRTDEKGTAQAARDAMELEGVKYDYFNETPPCVSDVWGDQRKVGAHYFIDDRNAGGIPDIETMRKEIIALRLRIRSEVIPHNYMNNA